MILVLRFLTKKSTTAASIFGTNTVQLTQIAEVTLLRYAQMENPPTQDHRKQLHLFRCETTSLWKSKGRLANAMLPSDAITPTFLPAKSYITTLLILHTHSANNHCGVNHTLLQLRLKFWIPKGRSTVRSTIKKHCYVCKRYTAKPFTLPPFPVHPSQRVTPPQYPFQRIGMDFFGPMQYKADDGSISKYWTLLFTCLNTRAIHVDVTLDMTSQSVLHILRRFIATEGCPIWILCDNALSFKKVAECYSSFPTPDVDQDIIDYCTKKRIRIKFIPSFSPWQGGIYEKMVDIFKKSFRHAVGNRLMDIEYIKTLSKEAEAIVNTRPLTYVSDDTDHIPLRPIDFLRPSTSLSGPHPEEAPDDWHPIDTTREILLTTWKHTTQLLDSFWKRWSREYLTSLREQYKTTHKSPRSHEEERPKLNDIVLIHDSSLNRGQWKIGKIVGSRDDYKRSVDLRLPSKKVITRPNNLVYNLEISSTLQETQAEDAPADNQQVEKPIHSRHPMITRSRTSLNFNILTTIVSTLLLIQLNLALNTRCPNGFTLNKTILYATNCAKQGIAIARYTELKEERLCWYPVSCPLGAIRSDFPFNNSSPLCGQPCHCPKWATSCSFSVAPALHSPSFH